MYQIFVDTSYSLPRVEFLVCTYVANVAHIRKGVEIDKHNRKGPTTSHMYSSFYELQAPIHFICSEEDTSFVRPAPATTDSGETTVRFTQARLRKNPRKND